MFTRSRLNPILSPLKTHSWENKKLYNPGAIFHNGKYHLFYRAIGSGVSWKSAIGYAVSSDGENFTRLNEPLLSADKKTELRGLEDPRITQVDNLFYMAYASYDGKTPRLSVATSRDLKNWFKHGPVFTDWQFDQAGGICADFVEGQIVVKPKLTEWSKSGGIFPEKINNRFLMLFGEYRIWFAESDDGIKWQGEQKPFIKPRPGNYFDNTFVEMGPPPIKTKKGWLVLYHGVNNKHVYRIGFFILDLKNPKKILYRSDQPIFEPTEKYEMSGIVDVLPGGLSALQKMTESELKKFLAEADAKDIMPRVTFCCGTVVIDNLLRIYYGAGDSVICTAAAKLTDILDQIK